MIGFLMPEVVIYNALDTIVKVLRKDLEDHPSPTENDSLLYRIMGLDEDSNPLKLNIYNFFKQARKIISIKDNLRIHYGYSLDTTTGVDICILLPSEEATTTIGEDEGYLEDTVEVAGETYSQQYYTQMFKSDYQLMITSNNSLEVLTVYNVLKSMLLMMVPHLELCGLRNPHFSGRDIVMQDDLSPVPLFHKVLNISFNYEHNVPREVFEEVLKSLSATGSMISVNAYIIDKGNGVNEGEPGVDAEIY